MLKMAWDIAQALNAAQIFCQRSKQFKPEPGRAMNQFTHRLQSPFHHNRHSSIRLQAVDDFTRRSIRTMRYRLTGAHTFRMDMTAIQSVCNDVVAYAIRPCNG